MLELISVIRRCGKAVPLNIQKIRTVCEWACEGLNCSPLELEGSLTARLKDGITTKEIQDNLINCALEKCDLSNADWRFVAGRLHIWGYNQDVIASRGYGYESDDFNAFVYQTIGGIQRGKYSETIWQKYKHQDLVEAQSWINPLWDYDYDYAAAVLLTNRYLQKDELIQEMYLITCLLIASVEDESVRLKYAKQFYERVASRKVSLATPILANLRAPGGNGTSCFIHAIEDNLESIYDEVKNAARISKSGGGVGTNLSKIRATGSTVMGKENASGGVVPWVKLLNDTAVAVNQGGKRSGAITVALDIWHYDVIEFLEMQTENGDQRRKAYDVFPQLVIPDVFMKYVEHGLDWYLFDPYEVKERLGHDLPELWGDQFSSAYLDCLAAYDDKVLTRAKKINAKDLMKQILKVQLESGLPYLAFKDAINQANPNKHEGYIPNVNLCVAPETKILTDKGQFPISELEEENVNVWNGFEWSNVLVRKTGVNQELIKVEFSNGEYLECTPYHNFWVQPGYRGEAVKVAAKDLSIGDKLIKFNLPLIESESDIDFPYAYTHGFFSGDGSYGNGKPEIDLYGKKKELLPYINVRNKMHGNASYSCERESIAVYDDVKQDRLVCKLPLDMPAKFTVPLNGYTIQSRLEWLAGLMDSDGTIAKNGSNESIQVGSVNKEFLLNVRLMLQTLGVDSKVTKSRDAGFSALPDGKGGLKDYYCQASYRLLINSSGLSQLAELGLKTNRLKWTQRKPQRDATQFVSVKSIDLNLGRFDDTYCFTEHKRHYGVFNGILTGQCTESFSNVKSGEEIHSCNLISINLATAEGEKKIDRDCDLMESCEVAVRMLDNTIDVTTAPVKEARNHNYKYRTIGVGFMGLADYLALNNKKYDDTAFINTLFERLSYSCLRASADLASERGAYPAFVGSEWANGNIDKIIPGCATELNQISKWDILKSDIQDYGIRNSHIMAIAPNTSSSLIHGCTASVLPVYKRFFYDKASKGAVPIAPPFINDKFWHYQENIMLDQKVVVNAVSTIQKWIDTGISMELVFNLNQGIYGESSLTAKDIFDTIFLAWQKGCKAVYYIRSVQKDNIKDDGCTTCAN